MGYKAITKAIKAKKRLAKQYNVSTSSIVWLGDNRYIVVVNGKEIRVEEL